MPGARGGSRSSDQLAPTIGGKRRVFCCHMANFSRRYAPNSLAAVEECVVAGVPRLEVDVRFLADDGMLILHDGRLDELTTGRGAVSELDTGSARNLRLASYPDSGLCFLEDVVEAMRGSDILLQVDLKLMRPITERRAALLVETIAPLGDNVLVGTQAHWNLRPLAGRGVRTAFDPTLHIHYNPDRHEDGTIPRRTGFHGFRDDAPLAGIPYSSPVEYLQSRVADLLALVPAVEWMVDIATIRRMGSLGFALGDELARDGVDLAAWTMRDEGPERSSQLLRELFDLGVTTVITDDAKSLARYVRGAGWA